MSAPTTHTPTGSSTSISNSHSHSPANPYPTSNNPRDDLPTDNPSPDFPTPAIHATPDLPCTMSIAFQLAPRAAASASAAASTAFRRGTLTLERTSPTSTLSTTLASPGLFLYSRRLLIPHLTPDTLHDLVSATAPVVDLATEQIISNLPASYPSTLRQFASLHSQFTLFSLRDAAMPPAAAQVDNKSVVHGPDYVHARTHRGLTKISAIEWAALVRKWMPDMAVVPGQVYLPGAVVGKKAAERSVARSMAYLDAVQTDAPKGVPLWATVAGFRPADLVQAAKGVAERVDKQAAAGQEERAQIMGVVVDAPTLTDLTPAATHLPAPLPRYAPSVLTPDAMVRHLAAIDYFPSTVAFVLSSAGYALNVSLKTLDDEANGIKYLMTRERHAKDYNPLQAECGCWACKNHNAAYVYHLLDCHEMLGWTLLTIHNLYQLSTFFASIRASIDADTPAVTQSKLDTWLAFYTEHVVPEQTRILESNGLFEHAAAAAKAALDLEAQVPKVKKDKKRPRSAAFEQDKEEGGEEPEKRAAKRVRKDGAGGEEDRDV